MQKVGFAFGTSRFSALLVNTVPVPPLYLRLPSSVHLVPVSLCGPGRLPGSRPVVSVGLLLLPPPESALGRVGRHPPQRSQPPGLQQARQWPGKEREIHPHGVQGGPPVKKIDERLRAKADLLVFLSCVSPQCCRRRWTKTTSTTLTRRHATTSRPHWPPPTCLPPPTTHRASASTTSTRTPPAGPTCTAEEEDFGAGPNSQCLHLDFFKLDLGSSSKLEVQRA